MDTNWILKRRSIRLSDQELLQLLSSGNETALLEITYRHSKYLFNESWDFTTAVLGCRLEAIEPARELMLSTFEKLFDQRASIDNKMSLMHILTSFLNEGKEELLDQVRKSKPSGKK